MPLTSVSGQNINNLLYADDTVFTTERQKELRKIIDTVAAEKLKTTVQWFNIRRQNYC